MSVIWQHLGTPPPRALVDARLEMHWALQIPAAVGSTLATPAPDYAHLSFTWDREREALVGAAVDGPKPYRAGLRPSDLTLLLLGSDDDATFSLCGLTVKDGLGVLTRAITAFTGSAPAKALAIPDHEMPTHALGDGKAIAKKVRPEWAELGHWFENADGLLRDVQASDERAAPVRTWPHRFDMATLITLDVEGAEGEDARSINVGMSPGDEWIAEPYFYVTPDPTPGELFALEAGAWHTEGWTGVVLTGSMLVSGAQETLAEDFLRSTVAACKKVLEA